VARRGGSWWTLVGAMLVAITTALVDLSINVFAGKHGPLPFGLQVLRTYPAGSFLVALGLAVGLGVLAWWLERRRMAPLLPPALQPPSWVVRRPREVQQVMGALKLRRSGGAVGISTALHGSGGFGKTTLAKVACADTSVRRRFPGGVFWLSIGREVRDRAALLRKINDVLNWVAPDERPYTDLDVAAARLGALLDAGPRRLLVLDDVWFDHQLAGPGPAHRWPAGAGIGCGARPARRDWPVAAVAAPGQ
jgi:hypothetical protein